MKHIRKLRKKSESEYIVSIPVKIIKKFDWNADTYLGIKETKNGIYLTNID